MNALEKSLRERSPIAFREFMAAALYDSQSGYYAANINTVGRRGDFSTSASLDPAVGRAIGKWIARCGIRAVIEVGAGDGSLARQVRRSMGFKARWRCRYHIVETSAPLQGIQRERLSGQSRIQWHSEMLAALEACGGSACIFSNEVVDAFPATLLQWDGGAQRWREPQLAACEAPGWSMLPGPVVKLPLGSSLEEETGFADGQCVERHDSYLEWLAEWLPAWSAGEMLTVDYGDLFPGLYHRRPRGTLRAYLAQQRLESMEELLANPGRQDLTADVDFSDLEARSLDLGLETVLHVTQAEWLQGMRIKGTIAADPIGAGGAFRVLLQRRNQWRG